MANSLPLNTLSIHTAIEQDVQRLGFYVYDSLETEEVDLQINRQIYLLIDGIVDKFFGRKLKVSPEQGFQVDQVSLDNLRKQHVKDAATTLSTFDNGVKFTINTNYYHFIKGVANISYECYENGEKVTKTLKRKLRLVESKNIDEMLSHPFHKSTKESPIAEIAGNTLYIYTDTGFTVNTVIYDYIKKPEKVIYAKDVNGNYDAGASVTTDLDDSLQYMLIDMVVLKIMKIIEQPQQKVVNFEQDTI